MDAFGLLESGTAALGGEVGGLFDAVLTESSGVIATAGLEPESEVGFGGDLSGVFVGQERDGAGGEVPVE